MKIASDLKNNPHDNAIKRANLLAAHGHTIRYKGKVYVVTASAVGKTIYASAQVFKGQEAPIDMMGRTVAGEDLRRLAQNRLFS